jgi:hypothetical protein
MEAKMSAFERVMNKIPAELVGFVLTRLQNAPRRGRDLTEIDLIRAAVAFSD